MRDRLALWFIVMAKKLTTSGDVYDYLCNAKNWQVIWRNQTKPSVCGPEGKDDD